MPCPKVPAGKKRVTRKRGKTSILTASPYKLELEEALRKAENVKKAKVDRITKKVLSDRSKDTKKKAAKSAKGKSSKKKELSLESSDDGKEDEDTKCLYCIFSIGKVLNFFPVGGERECQPSSYNGFALAGICLNAYDCRQREGTAGGDCARGLGVCCVFEVSCGGLVQNNLTYFVSPGFPQLWMGEMKECSITIEKAFAGITQLRVDFVHFTLGQPNRTTGQCDEDVMILGEGLNNFTVCGQNHGQHIYYTLSSSETREPGELPSVKSTKLTIRMQGPDMPRIWLLRLAQLPLAHSAPHDCLQYFTANNGTIKTFNYAVNGRHLASQGYRACVRRNTGFCSVRYWPCDSRSFRISDGSVLDTYSADLGPGGLGGSGTGFYGPDGQFVPPDTSATLSTTPRSTTVITEQEQNDTVQEEEMTPVEDEEEGSGSDPQIMDMDPNQSNSPPPSKSFLSTIWSYIWPSWLWEQGRSIRWSPYAPYFRPDDGYRYYGYGNLGVGLQRYGRQRCQDRITIPCENEYFVSSLTFGPGVCDPHHCGNTFCPGQSGEHCQVETSIIPFAISVHFGPPAIKKNPEENIGACLKYQQLPCDS
ncbi:uncharacterized protein LOC113232286 [Hyposmocoma kahamanoa]|uniref:uncharacterized protein LOC113232286 n=1 Tax=Hyposmocoma kahamanoa TaxID=1477025 RepID=UPI000E6D9D8A|nr:uncharacterized protein LOC113232286 [Hyposmocoma kahamanoa]